MKKRSRMASLISIPEEVLVSEIFMRLPASCILTLRSVCTSWRRLTTDPSFVRAHAHAHTVSAEPVVYQINVQTTKDGELRMLKLDAHDEGNAISTFNIRTIPGSGPALRLMASCDGLLCFQLYKNEEEATPYYVCNPVTKIWTTVAASARAAAPRSGRSHHRHYLGGFYFHRSTGEYRLLRYSLICTNDPAQPWLECSYEVATVGGRDKSWRSFCELRMTVDQARAAEENQGGAETLALFGYRDRGSVAANGSLHWLHSITPDQLGVVAFDTESEKFSKMSAPTSPRNGLRPHHFQMNKMRGNLCLGRIVRNRYGEESMELWMLKHYATQQWVKLHTIRPNRQGFVRTVQPLNEEGDGEMVVRWNSQRFALYNFKLKAYKQMRITYDLLKTADRYSNLHGHDLIYYTESLVDPRTAAS